MPEIVDSPLTDHRNMEKLLRILEQELGTGARIPR